MADRSPKRSITGKPKASCRRKATYGLAAALVLAAVAVWLLGYFRTGPSGRDAETADDQLLVPALTPCEFRNASTAVGFVGSGECVECHRDEHKSYLQTNHSRSVGDIDVAHEPPDGEVRHDISGRAYRVYRAGGTLRLREFITDADGKEVVLTDQPAGLALGSGNYSRMYLVKAGDFLVEAPVTWYPRRNTWGMSAGYEKDAHQRGFTRAVGAGCMYCHAGRVETIGGADERLHVTEMAIGCERCHGPGELHVKERRAGVPVRADFDDTIVNLRHLSRERQEDVCAQCHLTGAADIPVRGRSKDDFRPGMRMADFVVNYRIDRPNPGITVSGQIEQMRFSRCYTESKTMTCTTCHDPHSPPDESKKVAYYRNKCLSCHKSESCGLPVTTRKEKNPNDNCVTCHMPRGPSDIPHFSFTQHRVGIHDGKPEDRLDESDRLVPVFDVSGFPESERLRLLGLANDHFAGRLAGGLNDETRFDPFYRALAQVFTDRARTILEDVRSRGLRDPDVEDFFSRLNWRKNPDLCVEHAEAVLQAPHIPPVVRRSALYNLATSHFDQGRYEQARPYLEELIKCERNEISLMLLAICHQKKGDLPEAIRLINEAILVAPDRADLHTYLASIYRQMGKTKDADAHLQRAKLLRLKVPQPG